MAEFPHIDNAPDAFGTGREVFTQIPGQFNQNSWQDEQAHIKLIAVPWCGDYDNVVHFENESARNTWLNAQNGYETNTAWRKAPTNYYKVEIPYTTAIYYNYLIIDLPIETSANNILPNVNSNKRVSRLCYFIIDAKPAAGSTTELEIKLDTWTTFIYRMNIEYIMLSQGHAPMFSTTVEKYLDNPRDNSQYLLTEDANISDANIPAAYASVVLNSNTYACIFTNGSLTDSWGTKYGNTPSDAVTFQDAAMGPECWCLSAGDLVQFFNDAISSHPSFLQTVLGIAAVPVPLIALGNSVSFCGHTLYKAKAQNAQFNVNKLNKSLFNYDSKYSNIAKLYTSPYAHIEINSDDGSINIVNIENTDGNITVNASLSLAWPYIKIDTSVDVYNTGNSVISWSNLGQKASREFVGRWYETIASHNIPIFAIKESAATNYDWATYYDRAQAQLAADNTLASSLASNSTALTNAHNSAANITANNAVTVALNNANTTAKNNANSIGVGYSNTKLRTDVQYDIGNSNAAFDAQQAQLGVAATNNTAQSLASAGTTAINSLTSFAMAAAKGDLAGGVEAAVSNVTGLANTAVDWQTSNASITVSQSNNENVYNQAVTSAYGKQDASINYNSQSTALANTTASNINTNNNNASTSIANNNAGLINTNAGNTKTTADANAQRAYDTATNAIANGIKQAALRNVFTHGEQQPNYCAIRPIMRQINIVTEPPAAIAYAGDNMLRYGYRCNFAWNITNWVPCKYFTYWRASDLWIVGAGNIAEKYQNEIKDILMKGVTVWNDPNKMGKVSIYDNGI